MDSLPSVFGPSIPQERLDAKEFVTTVKRAAERVPIADFQRQMDQQFQTIDSKAFLVREMEVVKADYNQKYGFISKILHKIFGHHDYTEYIVVDQLEKSVKSKNPDLVKFEHNPTLICQDPTQLNALKLALEEGIDPNTKINGVPLIILAVKAGNTAAVELLINSGADLKARKDVRYGGFFDKTEARTAMAFAIDSKNKDMVSLLIGHLKTDSHFKDYFGVSGLLYALKQGDADIVQLFIESGVDLNVSVAGPYVKFPDGFHCVPIDGCTLLMVAAYTGHPEIADKLLSAGANPDLKDEWGQTFIDYALIGYRSPPVQPLNGLAILFFRNKTEPVEKERYSNFLMKVIDAFLVDRFTQIDKGPLTSRSSNLWIEQDKQVSYLHAFTVMGLTEPAKRIIDAQIKKNPDWVNSADCTQILESRRPGNPLEITPNLRSAAMFNIDSPSPMFGTRKFKSARDFFEVNGQWESYNEILDYLKTKKDEVNSR